MNPGTQPQSKIKGTQKNALTLSLGKIPIAVAPATPPTKGTHDGVFTLRASDRHAIRPFSKMTTDAISARTIENPIRITACTYGAKMRCPKRNLTQFSAAAASSGDCNSFFST